MTKRMRRTHNLELALTIKNDDFIRPPRDSQRTWHLNRVVTEAVNELDHLHTVAPTFVRGADDGALQGDRTQGALTDDDIMEDWQIPVMQAMAAQLTKSSGDILEIGFGRGIGSDFLQAGNIRSHTIIECNDDVVARFHRWKETKGSADIRLHHGMWQDVLPSLGAFDGIFFHTYPLNPEEYVEQVVRSSTFAEHFFDAAAAHLKTGGTFTYLTNEADSISRAHQRALLSRFREVRMSVLPDLPIPEDTRDAMWLKQMIIMAAVK